MWEVGAGLRVYVREMEDRRTSIGHVSCNSAGLGQGRRILC